MSTVDDARTALIAEFGTPTRNITWDDILQELDDAGFAIVRKPPGRWGFYLGEYPDHVYERYGEDSARRGAAVAPGRVVVHWPHGGTGWEEAPDA